MSFRWYRFPFYLSLILARLVTAQPHETPRGPRVEASRAKSCQLSPIQGFIECLLREAHSPDDVVSLLPPNGVGRGVCDTLTLLRKSESLQGSDIQLAAGAHHPGIICGNGDIFLRMVTKKSGSHWSELELVVRQNRDLVPLHITFDREQRAKIDINPALPPDVPKAQRKRCTDCHGKPFLLIWSSYPHWPNTVGAEDDAVLEEDLKPYTDFLTEFRKRTEPRFSPVLQKINSLSHEKTSPYGKALLARTRPNAVLTLLAASANGSALAQKFEASPYFKDLKFTTLALVDNKCVGKQVELPSRGGLKVTGEDKYFAEVLLPRMNEISRRLGLTGLEKVAISSVTYRPSQAADWLASLYGMTVDSRYQKKGALFQELYLSSGVEYRDDRIRTSDFALARLAEDIAKSEKEVKPLVAELAVMLPLDQLYPDLVKDKDDPHGWDSLNQLGGYLSVSSAKQLCELSLRKAKDELDQLIEKLKKPIRASAPVTPLGKACSVCHSVETSPQYLSDPKNLWWVIEAYRLVEKGEMPKKSAGPGSEFNREEMLTYLKKLKTQD